MRLAYVCLAGGLGAAVLLGYAAARPQSELPRRLPEALPTVADLPGFRSHRGIERSPSLPAYGIDAWRTSDHARLNMGVHWMPTAEDAKQWPSRRNSGIQSPNGYLRRIATPRGIRAEEVWTNISPDRGPFSMAAIDGRCMVALLFATPIDTTDRGFGRQRGHTREDVAFVHRLLARSMDKLTAAGLTTRKPDSPSAGTSRPVPGPKKDDRR